MATLHLAGGEMSHNLTKDQIEHFREVGAIYRSHFINVQWNPCCLLLCEASYAGPREKLLPAADVD